MDENRIIQELYAYRLALDLCNDDKDAERGSKAYHRHAADYVEVAREKIKRGARPWWWSGDHLVQQIEGLIGAISNTQ